MFGVVHIKDRVLRSRLNITHPPARAADVDVHVVVRITFKRTAATGIKTYLGHSGAGVDVGWRSEAAPVFQTFGDPDSERRESGCVTKTAGNCRCGS